MISISLTLDYNGMAMAQSRATNNSVFGTAPNQKLTGKNTADNAIFSPGGASTLVGGAGDDTFYVLSAQDTVVSNGGLDTVVSWGPEYVLPGGVSNLIVQDSSGGIGVGNAMNNLLVAQGSGAYTLVSGGGDDVFVGNGSGDALDNGHGSTRFVIDAGPTHDVISNFRPGVDSVALNNFKTLAGFGAVLAAMTQLGGDVQLSLDGGQTITFRDTTIAQFSDRDFLLPASLQNYTLAFNDGFKSFTSSPDGSTGWMTTAGAGLRTLPSNNEAEYYSDPSVGVNPFSLNNGVLNITATKGSNAAGLPYNSGIITTEKSFGIEYGLIEVNAKLPSGAGLWPAAWLLPTDLSWPPEIDLFEQLGNDPNVIYVGTHSGVGGGNIGTTTPVYVGDTSAAYHTYGVDWEPDTITWYFDGNKIFSEATPADFHKPMYLLFNLAVGGKGSWPGAPTTATQFPATYSLNWVRTYASPNTVVQNGPAAVHSTTPVTITGATAATGSGSTGGGGMGGGSTPPPPMTTVGGHAYSDPNGRGASSSGLAGITVQLLNASGAAIAGQTLITGADGSYSFTKLAAGSYGVRFSTLAGYAFDAMNGNSVVDGSGTAAAVTVAAGQSVSTVSASYYQPAGVTGIVWYDVNNNGVQDGSELGAAGIAVQLVDASGAIASSTTTNGAGSYSLLNQLAGSYSLVVLAPLGGSFSKSISSWGQQGVSGRASHAVTLSPGATAPGGNAGLLGNPTSTAVSLSGWGASTKQGAGNFSVSGSGGGQTVTLGAGNSAVTLNGQSNTISIGAGNAGLLLTGDSQNVTLGSGASTIAIKGSYSTVRLTASAAGTSQITAAGYDETVIGAGAGGVIFGGSTGATSVTLGDGNHRVTLGGSGNTVVVGTGTSFIDAGIGQSSVKAAGGAVTITVGGWNNRLDAGAGNNTLHGGQGNDTFVLNGAGQGLDVITGFSTTNHDVLSLARTLAGTAVAADLSNIGQFVSVVSIGGNTTLSVDPTGGHGALSAFAVLEGTATSLQELLSVGAITLH